MRYFIRGDKLIPGIAAEDSLPIARIPNTPQPPLNPQYSFNPELQHILTGKQLLFEDIPFPLDEIQTHYENGYVTYRKGIEIIGKKPACIRCGNKDPRWFASYPCARCGETCSYCRHCLMMGRISECTTLIGWNGPEPAPIMSPDINGPEPASILLPDINGSGPASRIVPDINGSEPTPKLVPDTNTPKPTPSTSSGAAAATTKVFGPPKNLLSWNGTLSEGQEIASKNVVEAILQNQEHLVWAVCGAGKTEVLFAGIEAALLAQKRVCIATPRTDVVLELTPRLKAVFPAITVASLYGGSEDRHLYAPLTISTTHQLLRFYHAFDTVILDEVDAFPYTAEESLKHAVIQARKPFSAMIYLTATPHEKWQRECRSGKRAYTTIPARFHRHPLPVPGFVWCGNWQKQLNKNKLPSNIIHWVKNRLQNGKQALIFFPHIPLMEKALPILRQIAANTDAVHAGDPERKMKVQKMRDKEISLLLTTTILERGVTFPNIDVAVVGAEDGIFTESALVQIAGRAGRSKDYPDGVVTFFHFGKTEEMLKARKQIVMMNREGVKRGIIDYEKEK